MPGYADGATPTAAVGSAWPDGLRYLTRRPPAVGIDRTCCSACSQGHTRCKVPGALGGVLWAHEGDASSGRVEVQGIAPAAFKALLQFVYTDTAPELDQEA
jgi:hypothetical protein